MGKLRSNRRRALEGNSGPGLKGMRQGDDQFLDIDRVFKSEEFALVQDVQDTLSETGDTA